MKESQARTLLQKKLQGMTDAEAPLVWLGSLVENTPEAFIFEGGVYADGENPQDAAGFCAVNKTTGQSGLILSPPGPVLMPGDLKDFKWNDWTIV